jgi:hypothetical protein
MNPLRVVAALALAALVAPLPAGAAAPGDRVRVTILARAPVDSLTGFDPGDRVSGRLLAVRPLAITLARGDDPADTLAIPRTTIAAFETSAGRRGHALNGAFIGMLAGAFAGVAVGVYLDSVEDPPRDSFYGGASMPFLLGVGGGAGGLVFGTLIGASIKSDRWRPAELPAPPE